MSIDLDFCSCIECEALQYRCDCLILHRSNGCFACMWIERLRQQPPLQLHCERLIDQSTCASTFNHYIFRSWHPQQISSSSHHGNQRRLLTGAYSFFIDVSGRLLGLSALKFQESCCKVIWKLNASKQFNFIPPLFHLMQAVN